jgi:hypothetical protein
MRAASPPQHLNKSTAARCCRDTHRQALGPAEDAALRPGRLPRRPHLVAQRRQLCARGHIKSSGCCSRQLCERSPTCTAAGRPQAEHHPRKRAICHATLAEACIRNLSLVVCRACERGCRTGMRTSCQAKRGRHRAGRRAVRSRAECPSSAAPARPTSAQADLPDCICACHTCSRVAHRPSNHSSLLPT